MTNETLRMQMLAGVITESEYKAKLQESLWDRIKDTPKAWIAKIKGGASATIASAFSDGGIIIGKPVYFYENDFLIKMTIKSINYNTGISDIIYEKRIQNTMNGYCDIVIMGDGFVQSGNFTIYADAVKINSLFFN